jgi:predicted amidophosphoribosyltransferase
LAEKRAVIDCKHFFCLACITKWAEIENTCPLCKQAFLKITEKSNKKRKRETIEEEGVIKIAS